MMAAVLLLVIWFFSFLFSFVTLRKKSENHSDLKSTCLSCRGNNYVLDWLGSYPGLSEVGKDSNGSSFAPSLYC